MAKIKVKPEKPHYRVFSKKKYPEMHRIFNSKAYQDAVWNLVWSPYMKNV